MFPPPPALGHLENRHDTGPAALQAPNPHLTAEELAHLRHQLLHLRQRLIDEIARLESKAIGWERPGPSVRASSCGSMSAANQEAWEQLLAREAVANKRSLCREVDQALARMANQTYGICVANHELIPKSHLVEIPWTRYCAACEPRGGWSAV